MAVYGPVRHQNILYGPKMNYLLYDLFRPIGSLVACIAVTLSWSRNRHFHWMIMGFSQICDKVCQWVATDRWFSPVSSPNKTDRYDIAEILLKVALNNIDQNKPTPRYVSKGEQVRNLILIKLIKYEHSYYVYRDKQGCTITWTIILIWHTNITITTRINRGL